MDSTAECKFDPKQHPLPTIVDHCASVKPHAIYAKFPISSVRYDQGYHHITYHELANVINGIAVFLINSMGRGSGSAKIAYIGPNDVMYIALVMGAIKAGYSMFFPSPRNSIAVQIELFNQLQCDTIITQDLRPAAIRVLLEEVSLQVLEIPGLEMLLCRQHSPVPYRRSLQEVGAEPLLTIHTSGSTGLPKLMTFTHQTAAVGMKLSAMNAPPGYESQNTLFVGPTRQVYVMLPMFHGACLAFHLMNAIPFGSVIIAPPAYTIPSATSLVSGLKQAGASVAIIPPLILEELCEDPKLLDYCADNLEAVIYSGGHLPPRAGDIVAAKVRLFNQYGSTELGLVPSILSHNYRGNMDWKYLEFHPDLGLEFRPFTNDTSELYVVRHRSLEQQQLTFTYSRYTELEEYATGDLFMQHPAPEKENLWEWHARRDDILVFLTGEKVDPTAMEKHITLENPEIKGALLTGAQRFQPVLLLEPSEKWTEKSPSHSHGHLLNKIWPSIEKANKQYPAYARVTASHVLFTDPEKPMQRSGKGAIQRVATVDLYAEQLDTVDSEADTLSGEPMTCEALYHGQFMEKAEVSRHIHEIIKGIIGWTELAEEEDFFRSGMDSFQTIAIVRTMRRAFRIEHLSAAFVYSHPSISQLAHGIIQLKDCKSALSGKCQPEWKYKARQTCLNQYRSMIDAISPMKRSKKTEGRHCVLLTDYQHNAGEYLLQDLLNNPSISHVYCLAQTLQQNSFEKPRSIVQCADSTSVTVLIADLAKDTWGLPLSRYRVLQHEITLIIHNAWPINFNWPFSSFKPQILGTINLIRFCAMAEFAPRLFWTTSVGSLFGYQSSTEPVPRNATEMNAPTINGYAESRYVTEHLLQYAANRLQIPTTICRLSYAPPPVKSKTILCSPDWLQSLVVGSLQIGAISETLGARWGHINWIPLDLLSRVLVELALNDGSAEVTSMKLHSPVNLYPRSWEFVRDVVIAEICSITGKKLQIIPSRQWVQLIQDGQGCTAPEKTTCLNSARSLNPAMRFMDLYSAIMDEEPISTCSDMTDTAECSSSLARIPAVQEGWIQKWIKGWLDATT